MGGSMGAWVEYEEAEMWEGSLWSGGTLDAAITCVGEGGGKVVG